MLAVCCNSVDTAFNNPEKLGIQGACRALEEEQESTSEGKGGSEKAKQQKLCDCQFQKWLQVFTPLGSHTLVRLPPSKFELDLGLAFND